jgi:hypothetical protein
MKCLGGEKMETMSEVKISAPGLVGEITNMTEVLGKYADRHFSG